MNNLQGLFDEFYSAAIALESLTVYQANQSVPDLGVERSRREAAQSVINMANELMDALNAEMRSAHA